MPIPRKRFGQHFLKDDAVISRIITLLAPQANDHLIEIGPGQGALTLPLLKHIPSLEAVELDRDLIALLQESSKNAGELHIFSADALTFDFSQLKKDDRLLRIVGNLPYNISTPLLFHLLTFAPIITDMLFMLQKEVAERLAAAPHNKDYGRLTVMVQYDCQVEILLDIPPTAFYPPPKVQSSLVRLQPYRNNPRPAENKALLATVVRQAFGQRRKTLRNSLRDLITDADWETMPIHPQSRPEDCSVPEFVALSNAINRIKP